MLEYFTVFRPWITVLDNILQYSTQYSIVENSTVENSTVENSTVENSIVGLQILTKIVAKPRTGAPKSGAVSTVSWNPGGVGRGVRSGGAEQVKFATVARIQRVGESAKVGQGRLGAALLYYLFAFLFD